MAESDISICSQALVRLGDDAISAFDETFGGQICGKVYPFVRRRVLISYPWRVTLIKSKQLNKLTQEPNSEWRNAYQLPPDLFFGPRTVWNSSPGENSNKSPHQRFEIFEKTLLADIENVKIDYQIDVKEENMPIHMVEMMVLAIRAEIAFAVTDQQNTTDNALIVAFGSATDLGRGGYFREATRLDAQTRPPSRQRNFPLTAVRGS